MVSAVLVTVTMNWAAWPTPSSMAIGATETCTALPRGEVDGSDRAVPGAHTHEDDHGGGGLGSERERVAAGRDVGEGETPVGEAGRGGCARHRAVLEHDRDPRDRDTAAHGRAGDGGRRRDQAGVDPGGGAWPREGHLSRLGEIPGEGEGDGVAPRRGHVG